MHNPKLPNIQMVLLLTVSPHLDQVFRPLTSMNANLNTYPILIPPASNTFHICHHPQPHHSQPYHAQSIIYHPSFIINGNSRY